MADSRNRGEENMSVTDDDERSQTTSSVASTDVGKCLITHSDYTAFVAKFVRHSLSFPCDDIYRSFVRFSLNPNVESVSRSKLISDATNVVGEVKLKLIDNFANLPNKVSVSADIVCDYWRRFHFISITCRWFDEKWNLQKRLIAFRQFDVEHTGSNISNMIHMVLQEYNLVEKTSSISFDNFIGDKTSLYALSQCCQSSVVGCEFFHIKCINHVLSLCAQECLASLKEHISPIRAAISRLTRSISLSNKWAIFCKDHDLEPKKILLDKPNRWNSTYKMLNDSFEYRETLCSFFEQQQCGIVLFPSQWDHCTDLCELLKLFKNIIVELSDVYFLNSWLVVDNCVRIAFALKYFSSCAYLGDCIARMKEKWLKYFLHIPDVFLVAKVLDPRVRVDGLEELLTMYYDYLFPIKNDDTPKPNEIASNTKQLLFCIFEKYMKNVGASKDTTSSGDDSNTALDVLDDFYRRPWKRRRDDSNPYAEVDDYLTALFEYDASEVPLDVLKWWSRHKGESFSIMSLIAKEILACPALTLSMEQAFSVDDCTLDARRSALTVEDVENRCLLEDWMSGEARKQGANLERDEEGDEYDEVNIMRL